MNSKDALTLLLTSPLKLAWIEQRGITGLEPQLASEIEVIATCSQKDFCKQTQVPEDKLAPQLRAIQIATRLLPKHVLQSLAVECAGKVLHFIETEYPDQSLPRVAIEMLCAEKRMDEELSRIYNELLAFQTQVRLDNDRRHKEEFETHGYIPLDRGIEIDTVLCAMSVVVLAVVVFLRAYAEHLVETVDQICIRFLSTVPLKSRSDAGEWVIKRMSHYLKEDQTAGS